MLFEAMHPLLQGIGEEKVRDVFGKTFDFLQKIQDETLDQDLLHGMQDTPDAVRNRLIAELFGFPTGPQCDKERCSRKRPCETKKKVEPTEEGVERKPVGVYPTEDLQKLDDEVLRQQSGSSKETLEDVRARVFGKGRCAASEDGARATFPEQRTQKTDATAAEGTTDEKVNPEPEPKPTPGTVSPAASAEKPRESAANEGDYEWKFPVDSWCDPKDAAVTVTDSIIRLNICKKEIIPETQVSTLKSLDFSVGLPDDADIDQISATYVEEKAEFVLRVPRRKPREEGCSRVLRVNFLRS